jgi:hypothetical protein
MAPSRCLRGAEIDIGDAAHLSRLVALEYYERRLDHFETTGVIPVTQLDDHGFQLQASTMIIPKRLQLYLTHSRVYGQYGDPWDTSVGVNWHQFSRHESASMATRAISIARRWAIFRLSMPSAARVGSITPMSSSRSETRWSRERLSARGSWCHVIFVIPGFRIRPRSK